jgi:hypothetical protein
LLPAVKEPTDWSGELWHREPGDVQELRGILQLARDLRTEPGLHRDHVRQHVYCHAILHGAIVSSHQREGVEGVLREHHEIAGSMGDDSLSVDPIVLRRRSQVADHFLLFGHQDPTIYLVRQRMALEPAIEGGVIIDILDLGEVRVREDAYPRHALFELRPLVRPYSYLHDDPVEPGRT